MLAAVSGATSVGGRRQIVAGLPLAEVADQMAETTRGHPWGWEEGAAEVTSDPV